MARENFDYVIIGAGSTGCVLAHRLSADPATKVLLLEAGPRDNHPFLRMPAAFAYTIGGDKFDWRYIAEKEPGIAGRDMPCPRGFTLGGSSSINAMAFTRGQREDYDDWAKAGLTNWDYASCLPYFKRIETFSGKPSPYRGNSGPMHVTAPILSTPLNKTFLDACQQAGFPLSEDTNGARQEGFGLMEQTIHGGVRESTARAYLHPVMNRKNLTVRTGCLVTKLQFAGTRVVAVDYVQNGQAQTAHAEREIVLSAGVIGSPQILMLSGIGPADELKALGIPVVHDSPEVGKNLQDHYDVRLRQICPPPVTMTWALQWYWKPAIFLEWFLFKRGAGATNHFETAGYVRTDPSRTRPDAQICFVPMMANTDGSSVRYRGHGYQASVVLLQPKSRGALTLRSAEPKQHPHLRFNYLQESSDLKPLREGLRHLRRILAQKAFDGLRGPEISPGADVTSDADLDAFIRRAGKSGHHPCGTCRMGADDRAVVDAAGRVRGIESLRVVDSSIIPTIPSANINAPTIMIGEKLSDAILDRALPPENPGPA